MATKLTLTVDPELVRRAKVFAKQSGTSLSAMFERHLRMTLQQASHEEEQGDIPITPAIAKLRGAVKLPHHDTDADPKQEWMEYLSRKHA